MNPSRLMTQTGTITRRAPGTDVDDYGNPVDVETTFQVAYEKQQAARSEDTVDANRQVGDWTLLLAPNTTAGTPTDVDGADKFTDADDIDYEFVGPPWPARNPRTGVVTHIEARVRRVA